MNAEAAGDCDLYGSNDRTDFNLFFGTSSSTFYTFTDGGAVNSQMHDYLWVGPISRVNIVQSI